MAKIEEKKPIIEEISESIKGAEAVVLAQYSGISVADDTALRKELREAGVTYKVYKNTMLNFAFKGTEFEPLCDYLKGPNAIAVSRDDATAGARIIAKYAKTIEPLKLIASVVEGQFYDDKGTAALADVPPRDVLLSRLLGSMQSPLASLARVLKQIADKGGAAPAAEAPAEAAAAEAPAEAAAAEAPAAEAPAAETPAAETPAAPEA